MASPGSAGGLTLERKDRDGVTVLTLSGRMVLGANLHALREAVVTATDRKLLVDMGDVSIVDSAGLGELVGCAAVVRNRGGKLKLLRLPRRIGELVKMARLETLFEIYESEDAAVASFSRD